jgi:tryptophan synthase alpha chain
VTAGATQQEQVGETAAVPSRIATAFECCRSGGRAALIPFITAGYPNLDTSGRLLPALVAGGADLIEIGVPFSDPLADGATIQRTSQIALANGTSLRDCFSLVRRARDRGIETPIIFMGYANPFFQYGLKRLAQDAERFGVDGFIVPDLPIEESDEFLEPLRSHGRDLIFLLAPTSTDARIQEVAERASGFIYCVSLTGVTGARQDLASDLAEYIERVRSRTDLPLAIGFGISKPDHVRQAAALADGVIVASALINHLDTLEENEIERGATEFVRELAQATVKRAGKPLEKSKRA